MNVDSLTQRVTSLWHHLAVGIGLLLSCAARHVEIIYLRTSRQIIFCMKTIEP